MRILPSGAVNERRRSPSSQRRIGYLGVGVGDHLGYLLTGLWSVLTGAAIIGTELLPAWIGWVGVVVGSGLIAGSAEFLGPNEEDGWSLAGAAIPILYVAWSLWLLAMGIALIL